MRAPARPARPAPSTDAAECVPLALAVSPRGVLHLDQGEFASFTGSVQEYLASKSPLWNLVGRVYFHLAENKRDPGAPFAFLASYATRLSKQARGQHAPLGRALEEYAGARDRQKLLALLGPVQRAAEKSPVIKALVDSGEIYHPLAWTPEEAYAFLKKIPACEASGGVVRVPDWWHAPTPSGGRRGVRTSSATATTRAACRAGGATCGAALSSISRSSPGRSPPWCAAARSTP